MRTHKIITLSSVLIVGLLLALAPASASTVAVQFVGMSGANQNGVYTYPYYLTVNGGPATWMMCDDFYETEVRSRSNIPTILELSPAGCPACGKDHP